MSFCSTVVDVCTKCMQRNRTFTVGFATSDFSAAKTTAYHDFDTFSTKTHCTTYCLFHCTTETDTAFQLACNVFSYKNGVHVSLFNFCNVNVNLFVSETSHCFFDIFDTSTTTTDNHTRFCSVNSQFNTFICTLDFNAGDTSNEQCFFQEVTNFHVFMKICSVIFISIPFCVPIFYDPDTQTMWINFLTHSVSLLLLSSFFNNYCYVASAFQNFESLSTGTRMNAFQCWALIDEDFRHI